MRNFDLQNVRDDLRGVEHRPARYDANTRVDPLPPFPAASILSTRAPFERSKVSQSLIDVCAIGSLALLVCSLASAVGILGFVFYSYFA